jgi:nascent polypeptide-associated complex subunit alpha
MNPKKMKGMLKSMGIDIEEMEGVEEVIIRTKDKEIIINNPSVAIMEAHGNKTYQISGEPDERPLAGAEPAIVILDSDVEIVAAQTGRDWNEAKAALLESKGDLAAAIMKLT